MKKHLSTPYSNILYHAVHENEQHLGNNELLAILLNNTPEKGLTLATQITDSQGSLKRLFAADWSEYKQLGLRPYQYARLRASLTLAQRLIAEPLHNSAVFEHPEHVKNYCLSHLSHKNIEYCLGLFLSARHHLINVDQLAQGTTDQASVYIREIIKKVIKHHACALIFVHNHPSGSTEPSQADIQFTQHLKQSLKLLEVRLLDHILVAGTEAISFAERGLLQP